MSKIHDVIIVGSGPAGWTAAIYTARAGFKPLVLAGELDAGGALMTTTEVENFPGWPEGIQGPELMEKMQAQGEKFGATVEYADVIKFELNNEIKILTTANAQYQAKAVILALGSGYKKLNVPGESTFMNKGVSYCATCDGFFFRGQEVAIVGGGDSALTEAMFLARFAANVHVIHRRDEFRASKVMVDRLLKTENIKIHWNSIVTEAKGEQKLSTLELTDTQTGKKRDLAVTGMFVAIGHDPRSTLVKDEITTDESGYIIVNSPQTTTNLPGVFACGDVVDHHYRQAITAAGSGCAAALDAQNYLDAL